MWRPWICSQARIFGIWSVGAHAKGIAFRAKTLTENLFGNLQDFPDSMVMRTCNAFMRDSNYVTIVLACSSFHLSESKHQLSHIFQTTSYPRGDTGLHSTTPKIHPLTSTDIHWSQQPPGHGGAESTNRAPCSAMDRLVSDHVLCILCNMVFQ